MNRPRGRKTAVAQDLSGEGLKSANIMTSAFGQTLGRAGVGGETQSQEGAGARPWGTTVVGTIALQSQGHGRPGQSDSEKSGGLLWRDAQVVRCVRC